MADDREKAREFLSSNEAKVLLLTCIDHRIQAQIPGIMRYLGYDVTRKEYDQTILAGASLAPQLDFGPDQKPHWEQTFYETLFLAIEAHAINGLVILDHTDCGAYKRYWNSMGVGPYEPGKEPERHLFFSRRLAERVRAKVAIVRPRFQIIWALIRVPVDSADAERMLDNATIEKMLEGATIQTL